MERPELRDYSDTTIVRIVEWEHSLHETLLQAIVDERESLANDFSGHPISVTVAALAPADRGERLLLQGTCSVLLEQHDGRDRYYDDCTFEINAGGSSNGEIIVGEVEVIITL